MLGEAQGEPEAVSSLGFSTIQAPPAGAGAGGGGTAGGGGAAGGGVGGGGQHQQPEASQLWLLVGHASGNVAVWDVQRRPARLVATISGQHSLPVS